MPCPSPSPSSLQPPSVTDSCGRGRRPSWPSPPESRSPDGGKSAKPPSGSRSLRTRTEEKRRPRLLREIERLHQVADLRERLPNVRPGVRPVVGRRVQPLALQEDLLDEL